MASPSPAPNSAGHGPSVWPHSGEFDGAGEERALTAVGGVRLKRLAEEYGTPLYVLDRTEFIDRIRRYRAAAPEVEIAYASKALSATAVVAMAHEEGLFIDVASEGELATARAAGVPGSQIILHGNNKIPAELERALKQGVERIVVDGLDDIELLAGYRLPAKVLIRVTPGVVAETHTHIATGGENQKFGLSIAHGLAAEAVRRLRRFGHLDLVGIHLHLGSNITSAAAFSEGIRRIGAFAHDVGMELSELNLGGGLGIPHTPQESAPSIEEHMATLLDAVDAALPRRPRLFVEPGRSLVGPAGVTLFSVGSIKRVPGVAVFAAVDGGLSDNPRPALYGAEYTVLPIRRGDAESEPMVVVGSHCESGDVVARDQALPGDLRRGDVVVVGATGAYTHAMSSNYNRFRRPAMVEVGDGEARLIVRRESLGDVLARDII